MSMPWDRFQPETEEELPYIPPEPEVEEKPEEPKVPATQGEINFGKLLKDAFVQALRESRDEFKEGATEFARDHVRAIGQGKDIDWANPTVTAETEKGRQLVVADARSRSWRTLVQGLAIDLTFAIVALLAVLADLDPFAKETWILFGALIIKTFVQTVVAYFMRLRVTPTIRTPGEKMAVMPLPVEIPPDEPKVVQREGDSA